MSATRGKTWKPCEMALDDRCVQEGCFWPSTDCFLREVVPAEIVADPALLSPLSTSGWPLARERPLVRKHSLRRHWLNIVRIRRRPISGEQGDTGQ